MDKVDFWPDFGQRHAKNGSEHILRNISKSRETRFKELGMAEKPKIWTRAMHKHLYRS